MKLTIPFLPDTKYINLLKNKRAKLNCLYFGLPTGPVLDARAPHLHGTAISDLTDGLSSVKGIKKYALLNTRFVHPDHYTDEAFIHQLLDGLELLYDQKNLDGLVFSDAYLLNSLAVSRQSFCNKIEAVPGINQMIDTPEKAFAMIDFIEQKGFLSPARLILDRSLNRDLDRLEKTASRIKQYFPEINIELLANEGCIFHCPFKLTHDAQISFANTGMIKNKTHRINTAVGCHAYFYNAPDTFLKSPFIRPEDTDRYHGIADSIKLCGRTLGAKFLFGLVRAYMDHSFDGNLFELMDASYWLSDHFHLDNKKLDPDFFNMVTGCTKDCKSCTMCAELFKRASSPKPDVLKPYEDYL